MIEYTKSFEKKECEIQYALCMYLVDEEVEFELEYRHENCIFDIVVIKNKEVILIIEVKREKGEPCYLTNQVLKYKRFEVPVIVIGNGLRLDRVAIAIRQLVSLDRKGEKYYNENVYNYLLNRLLYANTAREFMEKPKWSQKQRKLQNQFPESGHITRQANKQRMEFKPEI